MEGRLKVKITQFEDAVSNFGESLSIELKDYSDIVVDSIKSGRVQKFEFCVELLWKTLKVFLLEINGIDSKSPKMVIKDFYLLGLGLSLEEYERLFEMLDDRNRLSHIYNQDQFQEIYKRIVKSLSLFEKITQFLSQYK